MTEPPPPKRQKKQKKKGPLRAGDPFLTAKSFTHKKVTTIDSSGRQITQEVKVPLVLREEKSENTSDYVQEDQPDFAGGPYNEVYDEEPVRPMTRMVRLSILLAQRFNVQQPN